MKTKIRILIVDDHFIVRIGLQTSLTLSPEMCVVKEASTGAQALALYRQERPDIVLMDVRLPDLDGIKVTALLCQEFPEAKVIMISTYDAVEDIYRAFQAGARAYLLKNILSEELFQAIKIVHAGEQYISPEIARCLAEHKPGSELTDRELQVLQLMTKGLSNREIGEILGFTDNTAKYHIKNILSKLEVTDRTEAATAAFQRGILHWERVAV
jgi:DNA-binding NarL/FixJ family response regulator